jgi:hypothetical protein
MHEWLFAAYILCALPNEVVKCPDGERANPRPTITAVLSRDAMTRTQRVAMIEEVDQIMSQAGITIDWRVAPAPTTPTTTVVNVYVQELLPLPRGQQRQPLGAVPRVKGRLVPLIFVSRHAATRMVNAAGIVRDVDGFDYIYGRFVGRIIAHEFAHLFLQSDEHDASGLMRARFQVRDVLRRGADAYLLAPGRVHDLQRRMAMLARRTILTRSTAPVVKVK